MPTSGRNPAPHRATAIDTAADQPPGGRLALRIGADPRADD